MKRYLVGVLLLGVTILGGHSVHCQAPSFEGSDVLGKAGGRSTGPDLARPAESVDRSPGLKAALWNTTISPFQSADIGPEVAGVIREIWFDDGDFVRQGQVVARLHNGRYVDALAKAEARLASVEGELKKAAEEARIQEELFSLKAATRQEVLKARTDLDIAQARIKEARKEVDLAKRDLEACIIKAPFTGHVAQRFKQPNEPIERMGKILSLVDNTKVYAIANVEEQLAPSFEKGARAIFVHRSGKTSEGVIERVGSTMEPKARTRKVYCILDNGDGSLAAGMTGTLRVVER